MLRRRNCSAVSRPTISTVRSNEMFSSCPVWALVAGVKIGSAKRALSVSPSGSSMPQTVPLCWYSFQPDPARYPRTTHSTGTTSVLRTRLERPASARASISAGRSIFSTSVVIRWFGSFNRSNQKAAIWVKRRPLSGMPVGRTQSNALSRSVLTSRSWSPRS